MGLFSLFKKSKRDEEESRAHKRSYYQGAHLGKLQSSWNSMPKNINDANYELATLRDRARDICANNPYAKKYLDLCVQNIVGNKGIVFKSTPRDLSDVIDKGAANIIQRAFDEFCNDKLLFSSDGRLTMIDFQRLVTEMRARDGECFIVLHRNFNNDHKFAVSLIDARRVDYEKTGKMANGNHVMNGIEYNEWGRAVAYYVIKESVQGNSVHETKEYKRILASDVIHFYEKRYADDRRGITDLAPVMKSLRDLAGYADAELVGARVGAAQMGFLTTADKNEYQYEGDDEADDGTIIDQAEPGRLVQLPVGMDFKSFTPQNPSASFSGFVQKTLEGIATGLGVSYNHLANDMAGLNYSSARFQGLVENERWKSKQQNMIQEILEPIFVSWLEVQLLRGLGKLPITRIKKFKQCRWIPKTWRSVDPEKEIKALQLEHEMGLKSLSQIIVERGEVPEEVFKEYEEEKPIIEKLGLGEQQQKEQNQNETEAPNAPAKNAGGGN